MRVKIRVDRLSIGLEGDWTPVGEGVQELRIPEGKGCRVYYGWDGEAVIILLCGGHLCHLLCLLFFFQIS